MLRREELNGFASLGREVSRELRRVVREVVEGGVEVVLGDGERKWMYGMEDEGVRMELPFRIGDYTDFYAGVNHARNVGLPFVILSLLALTVI